MLFCSSGPEEMNLIPIISQFKYQINFTIKAFLRNSLHGCSQVKLILQYQTQKHEIYVFFLYISIINSTKKVLFCPSSPNKNDVFGYNSFYDIQNSNELIMFTSIIRIFRYKYPKFASLNNKMWMEIKICRG